MFSDSKQPDQTQVGARIRAARLARRMTLVALAKASGLTKGFISQVESGHSGVSLASLQRIAGALEVPMTSLVQAEDFPRERPEPDGLKRAQEPVLIAAHSLYQEAAGLAQLAGTQRGVHFLALIPAYWELTGGDDVTGYKPGEGMLIVLQSAVILRQGVGELRVPVGEVASWHCAYQYSIENHGMNPVRALLFIPEGTPLPALTRLPRQYASTASEGYSSLPRGPMRLVEMRARRQSERRR